MVKNNRMYLYLPGKGNSHFARLSAHAREYEDPYLTNNNMVQILTQPSLKKKVAHPYLNFSKKRFPTFLEVISLLFTIFSRNKKYVQLFLC